MLVAGDISIDGTKILLRQAHSQGRNYVFLTKSLIIIFRCYHKHVEIFIHLSEILFQGAWMWKRTQDQTVEDSLMTSERYTSTYT